MPTEGTLGGGILYNKKIYSDLGLQVPKTWAEFAANNEKIKTAGKAAPVCATFGDTWTSQLFVLADYYNVQAAVPDFAEKYTANKAHYADTPAALAGFAAPAGGASRRAGGRRTSAPTSSTIGQQKLAEGEMRPLPDADLRASARWPTNFPDQIDDIGFFGQPGDDAATNGATIWMPAATYIPKTTTGAPARRGQGVPGLHRIGRGHRGDDRRRRPVGPVRHQGRHAPRRRARRRSRTSSRTSTAATTSPALEFLSPVKGPSLEKLTVAVGSGLDTAEDAAALYDQDVEKQAKQLGLPGW